MKTYNYFIENLDTEKIEETKEKIANLPLVKEVNITEGKNNLALSYTLGDNDDEYDVFVAVADMLQKQGADIAFEDSKPKVVEEAERQEDNQEDSQEYNQEEVESVKPKKKGFFSRIPDFTTRFAELLVALLLFAIVDFSNYIASGICLVLASYEIFYDTICDITKKKFTDNLCASLVVIFGALCGHIRGAFFFAVGFSLLKTLVLLGVYLLKKKTEKHYLVKSFEDEFGETVEVENLKEGLVLNLSGEIYFSCEVVSGEAQIKKANGEILEVKEGSLLEEGDFILNKQFLTVKCLENYAGSSFEKKRESQRLISEQVGNIKMGKKVRVIYLALIITGIIYCFISPLFFDGGYMYNLSNQGIKGILVLALTAPIMGLWTHLCKEILRYNLLKGASITDFNLAEDLSNYQKALYSQEVFTIDGQIHEHAYGMIREVKDLGVNTQIAFGENQEELNQVCDALKLKNRRVFDAQAKNEASKGAILLEKLDGQICASVEGKEVFSSKKENLRSFPKVYSASKKAKLFKKLTSVLSGIVQLVLLCLTCVSVLSFSTAVIISLTLIGLVGASNLLQLIQL